MKRVLPGRSCGPKGLLFRKHLKLCASLDSQEMFPVKKKNARASWALNALLPSPSTFLSLLSPPLHFLSSSLLVSLLSSLPPLLPPSSPQLQTLTVLKPEKIKIAHTYKPVDLADSHYFPWGSPARCCPLRSEPVSLPRTQRRWRIGLNRRLKLCTHPSPQDSPLPALWSVAEPVATPVNLPPKIRVLVQSQGG